jgi:hypothetical protein
MAESYDGGGDGRDIRARVAELDALHPPAPGLSRQLCSGA